MTMKPPAHPADAPVATFRDLARALGGEATSFTGALLDLIQKADPGNRARLRAAFPAHVAAWETWMEGAPHITTAEVRAVADPLDRPPDALLAWAELARSLSFRLYREYPTQGTVDVVLLAPLLDALGVS